MHPIRQTFVFLNSLLQKVFKPCINCYRMYGRWVYLAEARYM